MSAHENHRRHAGRAVGRSSVKFEVKFDGKLDGKFINGGEEFDETAQYWVESALSFLNTRRTDLSVTV